MLSILNDYVNLRMMNLCVASEYAHLIQKRSIIWVRTAGSLLIRPRDQRLDGRKPSPAAASRLQRPDERLLGGGIVATGCLISPSFGIFPLAHKP